MKVENSSSVCCKARFESLPNVFTVRAQNLRTRLPGLLSESALGTVDRKLGQLRTRQLAVAHLVAHCIFPARDFFHKGGELRVV